MLETGDLKVVKELQKLVQDDLNLSNLEVSECSCALKDGDSDNEDSEDAYVDAGSL